MPESALWLAVDLSSPVGSLSLHSNRNGDVQTRAEVSLDDQGKHSESVIPAVETLLNQAGVALTDVDRFIVASGPGSFTGLRVAYAALKAFSFALDKPIEAVDGHEARALGYLRENAGDEVTVSTLVAREKFLVSVFRRDGDAAVLVSEDLVTALPDAQVLLVDRQSPSGVFYPLRSSHLALALAHARTRESFSDWPSTAAASPKYLGSRQY